MKKIEKIIIFIAAIFAVCLYFGVNYLNSSKKMIAVYHASGKMIMEFPLDKDNTYTFDGDYGKFNLVVKDGKVRAVDVECPNKICETMGIDDGSSIMNAIVCIPNAIYIELENNE